MKILYTALFGDYDGVGKIYPQDGWRYLLYTDQDINPAGWEVIKVLPEEDKIRQARRHKIIIPAEVREAEVSIWVDANILPKTKLDTFVGRHTDDFVIRSHPRGCIYKEGDVCIEMNKGVESDIYHQLECYMANKYPRDNGMVESGIIIRRPSADVDSFCRMWMLHVTLFSTRDQLSFPYVAWSKDFKYKIIPWSVLQMEFIIRMHK